jgi:hypothetical protein
MLFTPLQITILTPPEVLFILSPANITGLLQIQSFFRKKAGLSRAWIIHLIFIKSLMTIANAVLLVELKWFEKKTFEFYHRPTDRAHGRPFKSLDLVFEKVEVVEGGGSF